MDKKEEKTDRESFMKAFYEASNISLVIISIPLLILLIGIFIDKKLNSTPLFIVLSIILGIIIFIYNFFKLSKKFKDQVKK